MSDFLELPKKRRRGKFALQYDPDLVAEILQGDAERLHRVRVRDGHKGVAARMRKRLERQRAHWRKRTGKRVTRLLALPGWQVLAARLDPGAWYGRPDMCALLPEFARKSVSAWLDQKLWSGGLVERAPNPAYDRERAPGRQVEPQWLYRLTVRGAELAAQWRNELGE